MRELMTQKQIDADPAAWASARRNLITATDMASILAPDEAFGTPMRVYLEKTAGIKSPDRLRWVMARNDERALADIYAGLHPDVHPGFKAQGNALTNPGLCVADDCDWLGATFDRIEEPDGTVVELKTWWSDDGWGQPPHGEIPLQYHVQCLTQAAVRGAAMVKLAVYFRSQDKFSCYWIPIDDNALEDIAYFIGRAQIFREDHILPQRMPPADGHPATTLALKSAFTLAGTQRVVVPKRLHADALRAQAGVKAAEERLARAKNRIAALQGDAELSVTRDGQPVMQRSLSWPRRISSTLVRANYPEVAEACTVQPPEDEPQVSFLLKKPKGSSR